VTRAVLIPVDGPAQLVDIPDGDGGAYRYLAGTFEPDAFACLHLGDGVDGWVGDSSLLLGLPHNDAATDLANAAYLAAAGRHCHVCVHGPMVVLGTTQTGACASVPDRFLAQFLPSLAPEGAS
jgi:hypothetical protein